MTWYDRIRCRRKFTFRNMQVSSANTTGSHSKDQFVWLRRWIGNIADSHTSRLIDDSCTHGYTSLNKLTPLRLDNGLSYFIMLNFVLQRARPDYRLGQISVLT